MKTHRGVKSSERLKRTAMHKRGGNVLTALQQPFRAVEPVRFILSLGTILLLSALLLFPYPHVQRLLHRFNILGVTLLVAILTSFVILYIKRFEEALYASTKRLLLLTILVCVSVLGLKIGGILLDVHQANPQFGYIGLLCITACAMSIAVLVDARISVLISAILSILSGIVLGNEAAFSIMTFSSSLVAMLSVSEMRSRGDLVRATIVIALANVAMAVLLGEMRDDRWHAIWFSMLWAVAVAPLAVALFSIWVSLFERPFGLTTHIGLLELSDPNRPLLKRFMNEAPGTYAHSIMVGNLAAAAAEAIGADALLARVAAYYHDLGKMRRAEFFVENQAGENVHEKLNPSLSALVVTAHVKEGLEIADEEKLPPEIKDIIVQHHGTSLMRYFYHRAQSDQGNGQSAALEHHFRYSGPKPQSKEAAIMMLADAAEAASHTLERPNPARVEELVQSIIDEKVADGQLEESPITLRDLKAIRETFVPLLCGMLHSRIEYPQAVNGKSAGERTLVGERGGTTDGDTAESTAQRAVGSETEPDGPPLQLPTFSKDPDPSEAGITGNSSLA
jgi:putative nucleotidyltransferase with HDIG domain